MKEAEAKLSNLRGTNSKEMEEMRKKFAKDMEALKKAMEKVLCSYIIGLTKQIKS